MSNDSRNPDSNAASRGSSLHPQEEGTNREGGTAFSGTSPSNTVPANYINTSNQQTVVLRYGIDSLYLSYPGELSSGWQQRLEGLKLAARSTEEGEASRAQVQIAEHLFEVRGKGQGKFAYVLVDNHYHIALSSKSASSLPLAYVQLSSELITAIGYEQAEAELRYIINTFGSVKDDANISRVDIFVDYISDIEIERFTKHHWITRCRHLDAHWVSKAFTGWSIGRGGVLSARLYDKTIELKIKPRDYLKQLWQAQGWQEGQTVYRLEFQLKREGLKELEVSKLTDLKANLGVLWRYVTQSWLRLAEPSLTDTNQTRWPTLALWQSLSALDWQDGNKSTGQRVRKERLPSDDVLFVNGLGSITSFMASRGITDLGEGFGEFLAHADRYHQQKGKGDPKQFRKYIQEKVVSKARRYNTLDNRNQEELRARAKQASKDYKQGKDGE